MNLTTPAGSDAAEGHLYFDEATSDTRSRLDNLTIDELALFHGPLAAVHRIRKAHADQSVREFAGPIVDREPS